MPQIMISRIVLALALSLISTVLLWFTLPFPATVSLPRKATYIQDVLQSGSCLITVHKSGWTFTSADQSAEVDNQEPYSNFQSGTFNAVILSWRLQFVDDIVLLQLGKPWKNGIVPDFGGIVNLTDLAIRSPSFVKEEIHMWTPAGDQDGINLPYFDYADATLIYHQASETWQAVHLRFLVPATGIVQVWKDMPDWNNFNDSDIVLIDDVDRARGLLATFDLSPVIGRTSKSLEGVQIRDFNCLLPTKTYPIRRLILTLLKPVASLVITAVDRLGPVLYLMGQILKLLLLIGITYFLVVVVCWMLWGNRRPFGRWAQRFWLTKRLHRYIFGPPSPGIWGPSGPLKSQDEENIGGSQPEVDVKPLTGILNFFTSNSPLDSLLITFKVTRWMVLPLYRSNRSSSELSSTNNKSGALSSSQHGR
ncbi:hypothetical protein H2198_009240 [Neophaeococcomyces mojaviensis]|uniref:Uncharacterized protein n=1 Tax=Neophaeococcomyces mojaviensis TaxID=3383035 RepID=A0ACC2ZV12_9EURO|nr:hypothetical protein H2198_009240 [Knufia sp. JES_112]